MKQPEFSISYFGGLILNLLIFILLLIILTYVYKLETIGCECASHPNREFIKSYTIISLVFLLMTSFISITDVHDNFGESVALLFSLFTVIFYVIFIVYIYLTFEYVRFLINEKCKCSEGLSRDIIMIGTMIELLLFVVALFTGIIVPVLIETVSSLMSKLQGFKNDMKESIRDPISGLKKTPQRLTNSAKSVGKFLKKSVKDLKKLSKK